MQRSGAGTEPAIVLGTFLLTTGLQDYGPSFLRVSAALQRQVV